MVAHAQTSSPNWFKWLDKNALKRIQITGNRRLGYHTHRVTGDNEAFNNLNYSGQGSRRFTDFGQVHIEGRRVFDLFNFSATILDSRFTDPQGQKFSLDYTKKAWTVNLGDINGRLLNTNPYASFNKSIRGASVEYKLNRFHARTLYSESKGSARTVSLGGNNSAGPYYLNSSQLVIGSERVLVDGQPQVTGQDYVINYEVGSVTFVNKIISVTSTIVVNFEALGFNERKGIVQGLGVAYDMGRWGRIGATGLSQIARGGAATSQVLEKFQGYGPASTPYVLQFEPLLSAPIVVKIDGVIQNLGTDYTFDPDNTAIFYFTRFVPTTSNVDVVYTPKPRGTAQGNRQNIGFDWAIPLGKEGKGGLLQLAQAQGKLTNSGTPTTGWARGADLLYRTGPLQLHANVRQIPATYVAVETRTFSRNERAHDLSLTMDAGKAFQYGVSHTNSAIANQSTDASGSPITRFDRFTTVKAFAYRSGNGNDNWRLEHSRTKSRFRLNDSNIDSTGLTTTQRLGKMEFRLGFDRQAGSSSPANGTATSFKAFTGRVGTGYAFIPQLNFSLNASLSRIKAGSQSGTGKDYNLGLAWDPSENLHFSFLHALSDSGLLAALSTFQNGWGIGYNGNGFTGGSDSATLTGATNLRLTQLRGDWKISPRVSFVGSASESRASGSVSSNSNTRSAGFGLLFDFGKSHQLLTNYDVSNTSYLGSTQQSGARTLGLAISGSPPGLWSYSLGANFLLSTGSSAYRQDSSSFDGIISYRIGSRQSLSFDFQTGQTRGYLPQNDANWGLTYSYRIWQSLALNASYRFRNIRNLDPTVVSGAYRSTGFDIELSFDFGR